MKKDAVCCFETSPHNYRTTRLQYFRINLTGAFLARSKVAAPWSWALNSN